MQIVKKESFRSSGNPVNKTDDMYRVTVDMSCREYQQFAKYAEGKLKADNSDYAVALRAYDSWKDLQQRNLTTLGFRQYIDQRLNSAGPNIA